MASIRYRRGIWDLPQASRSAIALVMDNPSTPIVAQRFPFVQDQQPGAYWWCACGRSKTQPFFECLQPHQATFFASGKSTLSGDRPVPLCEPSQNGWVFERPQAHHQ